MSHRSLPRSLPRGLAVATGVALVAVIITTTLAIRYDIDDAEHERYSTALRQALELDARLGEEVAKARLGIVTHYDELVRVWDQLRHNQRALFRIPRSIQGDRRALLERDLEAYREALEQRNGLMEAFKSDHAVLRNSLRALPRNIERWLERSDGAHPALDSALEALLRDALLLVLAPSDEQRANELRCGLELLGLPSGCGVTELDRSALSSEQRQQLRTIRSHAHTILGRARSVASVVDHLMAVPVASRGRSAGDTYAMLHQRAVDDARGRWALALVAAILLLLLASGLIIARLQASAQALQETGSRLEVALDELRVERDREVELANLKSRFVSMTSHEFRTPLSVILSSAELLEAYGERWERDKELTHLGRIQDAARGMSHMLDRVLLIGRAESGMLEANPRLVRPTELAAKVAEEIRSTVGAERELVYEAEGGDEEMLLDESLLRHVLSNLLSNAFKYSPVTSTVRFSVTEQEDGVLFEISDEGIGIPEEELEQLFEAFHRCSNASAIPGTGLGLAVVKRSLDVHQGTIEVDSRVGRGTRFAVRVPELKEAA